MSTVSPDRQDQQQIQTTIVRRAYVLTLTADEGENSYYHRVIPPRGPNAEGLFATREEAQSFLSSCIADPQHPIRVQLGLAAAVAGMKHLPSSTGIPEPADCSLGKIEVHAWPIIGDVEAPGFPRSLVQLLDAGTISVRELLARDSEQLAAWATLENLRAGLSSRSRAWAGFVSEMYEIGTGEQLLPSLVSYGYRTGQFPSDQATHEDLRTSCLKLADAFRNDPSIVEML